MQKSLLLLLLTFGIGIIADVPLAAAQSDAEVHRHSRTLVFGDLAGLPVTMSEYAVSNLHGRHRADVAASLILAMRYNRPATEVIAGVLSSLTGETGAETWFDWMLWQEAHPEIAPHPSYAEAKSRGADRPRSAPSTGSCRCRRDATIRQEEVVWGGVVVDGIPALDNPKLIPAEQADYLIPGELVFGVEINGDARAYPLRILDWHEMLNDVVGGVPVSAGLLHPLRLWNPVRRSPCRRRRTGTPHLRHVRAVSTAPTS